MKRIVQLTTALFLAGSIVFVSCSDNNSGGASNSTASSGTTEETGQASNSGSDNEVHGDLVKPEDVKVTTPLNAEWVASGKSIYDLKCQSCHKLTADRLVGPGWKGVTQRREPAWIMNMITNVDVMLEQDPEAQKLLEQCLVRMPNQNITKDDARHILEFMRSNDGVQ